MDSWKAPTFGDSPKVSFTQRSTSHFGNIIFLGGKKYRNSPILHPVSNKKSLGFRIERTPRVASTTGNHLPCDPVEAGLAFDLLIESQDLSEGNGHDFGELYTPQKLTCSNGQNAPIFPIGNTSSDDWFSVVMLICQSVYTNYGLRCSPTR